MLCKDEHPVGEIPELTQEIAITPHLKVFPTKGRVAALRGIGSNGIADLVGLEVLEELI
jgi:hypothetical protein